MCFYWFTPNFKKEVYVPADFLFTNAAVSSSAQLSSEACPNNWLQKELTSVQLHPNITKLCPAMVVCEQTNINPQYK